MFNFSLSRGRAIVGFSGIGGLMSENLKDEDMVEPVQSFVPHYVILMIGDNDIGVRVGLIHKAWLMWS